MSGRRPRPGRLLIRFLIVAGRTTMYSILTGLVRISFDGDPLSGLAVLVVTTGLVPLVRRADDGVLEASAGLIYGQTLGSEHTETNLEAIDELCERDVTFVTKHAQSLTVIGVGAVPELDADGVPVFRSGTCGFHPRYGHQDYRRRVGSPQLRPVFRFHPRRRHVLLKLFLVNSDRHIPVFCW